MNVVSLEQAQALLQAGQCCLDAGDRAGAAAAWRGARAQPATRLAAHNLIELNGLEGAFAQMFGLNCAIAPQDDIFHFFAGHPTSNNPLRDYLADGWRTLSELLLLLERADQPLVKMNHVLEFASGHGRFTRHLVKAIGPGRVTVSDVVPGAVAFSTTHFGVQGFVSAARPAQLHWPRRYGLVFVLSLFTHLPRATWSAWLARLWEAVAPGGVLVFTTHGALAAGRAGVTLDAEGFHFHPESESHAIDVAEYGTSYTSRGFVEAELGLLRPAPTRVDFEPAWFWAHQDAWVLQRAEAA